jgi:hypothetical protein
MISANEPFLGGLDGSDAFTVVGEGLAGALLEEPTVAEDNFGRSVRSFLAGGGTPAWRFVVAVPA